MIQVSQLTATTHNNYIRLDVWGEMTSTHWRPLVVATSQQTNRSKIFMVSNANFFTKERYVEMYFVTNNSTSESPIIGIVNFGTREYPYGLYDFTLYENSGNSNLDPEETVGVIYRGLMNVKASGNPSVTYNEYESTQEQNVYITNTTVF